MDSAEPERLLPIDRHPLGVVGIDPDHEFGARRAPRRSGRLRSGIASAWEHLRAWPLAGRGADYVSMAVRTYSWSAGLSTSVASNTAVSKASASPRRARITAAMATNSRIPRRDARASSSPTHR